MGRTKRHRKRNKQSQSSEFNQESIKLQQFLVKNGWQNSSKLIIRNFKETERGVTSSKSISQKDILISIPYHSMITYKTIVKSNFSQFISHSHHLKIHDILALFLVKEKSSSNSRWIDYLESLPKKTPPLPWLCGASELNVYPADLKIICEKNLNNFGESLERAKKSMSGGTDCVLDEDLFKWAYVLVNTRAVYVDPHLVCNINEDFHNGLLDEPSMALCPFLDMFNHHFLAKTDAGLVGPAHNMSYQLKTLTRYEKYQQIFISYGAHDNLKLLTEYGFFIPGNALDVISFALEEVLNVLVLKLNEFQYRFVKSHGFDCQDGLYLGREGASFNLKTVLFVGWCEDVKRVHSVVFTGVYPKDFQDSMSNWIRKLSEYKRCSFERDYRILLNYSLKKSESAELVQKFLLYRLEYVDKLKNEIDN